MAAGNGWTTRRKNNGAALCTAIIGDGVSQPAFAGHTFILNLGEEGYLPAERFLEKLAAKAEKAGVWAVENRSKVARIQSIAAALVGASLMIFAYVAGHVQFDLILAGARTQGTVVAEIRETTSAGYISSSSLSRGVPTTVYRPVVEFEAVNRVVRFEDWLARPVRYTLGEKVPVRYDAANPAVAMIDREGAWNWMPWGPAFIIGALLLAASIKHLWKSKTASSL